MLSFETDQNGSSKDILSNYSKTLDDLIPKSWGYCLDMAISSAYTELIINSSECIVELILRSKCISIKRENLI